MATWDHHCLLYLHLGTWFVQHLFVTKVILKRAGGKCTQVYSVEVNDLDHFVERPNGQELFMINLGMWVCREDGLWMLFCREDGTMLG